MRNFYQKLRKNHLKVLLFRNIEIFKGKVGIYYRYFYDDIQVIEYTNNFFSGIEFPVLNYLLYTSQIKSSDTGFRNSRDTHDFLLVLC